MRYYLAYGSNLNQEQMQVRCPESKLVGVAELQGYELLFRQGNEHGSFLNLEQAKDPAARVPVAIWQVSDQDEQNLDRYEEYPIMYYKQDIDLECYEPCAEKDMAPADEPHESHKVLHCFLYRMTQGFPPSYPSPTYLHTVQEGYEQFHFDASLLARAYEKSAPLL